MCKTNEVLSKIDEIQNEAENSNEYDVIKLGYLGTFDEAIADMAEVADDIAINLREFRRFILEKMVSLSDVSIELEWIAEEADKQGFILVEQEASKKAVNIAAGAE